MDFLSKLIDPKADRSRSLTIVTSFLAVTGFVFVVSKLFNFLRLLLSLFVLPGKPLESFGPRKSYALITGASDGIGKEFALQIAQANHYSLLLISRTASKLDALAQDIHSRNPSLGVKSIAFDFSSASAADYANLGSQIKELDVSVLINNVGISHDIPVVFAQTSPHELENIIKVNCLGTLRITQLILPGMIARRGGLILTMGSFGGLLPSPLLATYSGSKAFLQHWSTALGSEVAQYNITVQLVQSYLVTSAMSKIRKPSFMVPTAKDFVKSVLERIGRTGGAQGWAYTSTPYQSHALWQWAVGGLLGFTNERMGGLVRRMHEGIRKRALRKREMEARKKGS